jgi:hypothetical protein
MRWTRARMKGSRDCPDSTRNLPMPLSFTVYTDGPTRMTCTTRASVPTLYRSRNDGSSVSGVACVRMPIEARSMPRASSIRRTLRGRPTLIGTTDMGNRTEFLSGRMGMEKPSGAGGGPGHMAEP